MDLDEILPFLWCQARAEDAAAFPDRARVRCAGDGLTRYESSARVAGANPTHLVLARRKLVAGPSGTAP